MAAWDYLDYMNPQRKRTLWPQPYDPATAAMGGMPQPEPMGPEPVQPTGRPSLADGVYQRQQAEDLRGQQPPDVEPVEQPAINRQAQEAYQRRMDERAAAEERMKKMPLGRKILGGVLEGIGSGRRSALGGLARVGGGALTGRRAVEEIDQTLPAYDRAADNERQANIQTENAGLRRENLARQRQEDKMRGEDRAERQQINLATLLANGYEEIAPDNPYDPKRHATQPLTLGKGQYAPIREEVRLQNKAGVAQEGYIPLSEAARKKFPQLPERLPPAQAAQYERLAVEKPNTPNSVVVKTPDGVFVVDKGTGQKTQVPGLRGTPEPRDPNAVKRGTQKQFADVEFAKNKRLESLQREAKEREDKLEPMSPEELRDRKQQIQDEYELRIQTLGGETKHFEYPAEGAAPRRAPTPAAGAPPRLPGQQPQRPGAAPKQNRRVRVKLADGQVGTIDESEFNPDTMTLLQ